VEVDEGVAVGLDDGAVDGVDCRGGYRSFWYDIMAVCMERDKVTLYSEAILRVKLVNFMEFQEWSGDIEGHSKSFNDDWACFEFGF
jgi:hypothetical protein